MDDNNLDLHEKFKLLVNNIENLEKETLSFANAKKDLIDTNNDFRELLLGIKELNSSANELLDESKKVLSKDIIIKYDEMILNNKEMLSRNEAINKKYQEMLSKNEEISVKYEEMILLFNNKIVELNLVTREIKKRNMFNTLIIIIGIIVIIAIEVLFKLF